MKLHDGANRLEIEAVDRVPHGLPTAGDTEFSVAVSSHGFTGHGFAWVSAQRLAEFVARLRDLDHERQGTTELDGCSLFSVTDEFRLRVWSVDRLGHMAVAGRIMQRVRSDRKSAYAHAVEFGFEFDPTQLPPFLAGFENIAAGKIPIDA